MINNGMLTSITPEWATPQKLFDALDQEFHFTLDPCSTHENAKCQKHYTKEDDGLSKSWQGEVVFCNPPYGKDLPQWVKKCYEESRHADVVMLIPARTDTRWFHDYVYHNAQIHFIRGRIKFQGARYNAPFPSMLVIFKKHKVKSCQEE